MGKVSCSARIFGILLLAAGALATAASADTFSFSYNFPNHPADLGSGTITATYDSGDQYTVTGITGTSSAWGNITGPLAPGSYLLNDNLIFYPNTPYLDFGGISFDAGTTDLNIYWNTFSSQYLEESSVTTTLGGTFTLTPLVSPVPEPTTVALVSLALFAGCLGWFVRRKRSASAYFVE